MTYMFGIFWQARSAISPTNLASVAVDQFQKVESNVKLQREELKALTRDLGNLQLQVEGTGRLSFSLSREQILGLAENYLSSKFVNEGGTTSPFTIYPKVVRADVNKKLDGALHLPSRTIFVKLTKHLMDERTLQQEVEKAREQNPSDTWIFTHQESQRIDVKFEPFFVSENRILWGHFRVMPLTDLIKEISYGHFTASIESKESKSRDTSGKGTAYMKENDSEEEEVTRFLLARSSLAQQAT